MSFIASLPHMDSSVRRLLSKQSQAEACAWEYRGSSLTGYESRRDRVVEHRKWWQKAASAVVGHAIGGFRDFPTLDFWLGVKTLCVEAEDGADPDTPAHLLLTKPVGSGDHAACSLDSESPSSTHRSWLPGVKHKTENLEVRRRKVASRRSILSLTSPARMRASCW